MYKLVKPFFLMCETPLHAGSGSDLGIIDLPIQRERHTGFPKIEGSGIKGSIREEFERLEKLEFRGKKLGNNDKKQSIALAFGPEDGGEYAAALSITDARILLFPVKSVKGVYGWITCPLVLDKFKNELKMCGINFDFEVPSANATPVGSTLFVRDNKVVLEEYTFNIENKEDPNCTSLAKWLAEILVPDDTDYKYLREKISKDIIVLSDDDFRDFVQSSTEVITRTRIDNETGTVASGALFTEEYLPAETVLYALVLIAPVFNPNKGEFSDGEKAILEFFQVNLPEVLQVGGNATLGKGIVRVGKKLLRGGEQ